MTEKVWFITGASRGFGGEWTRAVLKRGDKVAAAARDTTILKDLHSQFGDAILPIELDVTDRVGDFAAVSHAHDHFGRIDVLVNNAGYGQFGCIEEISEREARDQMETNFFGALWITQATLPYLRDQGSGHIIQVSSGAALVGLPDVGIYSASKYALEGFSEALSYEIKSFGIKLTLVEPGMYATGFVEISGKQATPMPAYAGVHEEITRTNNEMLGEAGDPAASAAALFKIVDAEKPPLRVMLGIRTLDIVKSFYDERLSGWEEWQPVAAQAQG